MCITVSEIHAALTQRCGNSIDYNILVKFGLANYLKWLHTSFLKVHWKRKNYLTFPFYAYMNVTVTFITSEDGILQVIFLVQTGYIPGQSIFFLFTLKVYWGGRQEIWEQETASQGFITCTWQEACSWPLE